MQIYKFFHHYKAEAGKELLMLGEQLDAMIDMLVNEQVSMDNDNDHGDYTSFVSSSDLHCDGPRIWLKHSQRQIWVESKDKSSIYPSWLVAKCGGGGGGMLSGQFYFFVMVSFRSGVVIALINRITAVCIYC